MGNSESTAVAIPQGELAISQRMLGVKKSTRFLEATKVLAEIGVKAPRIRVASDEDEVKAIDTVALGKKALKDLEDMRAEIVALPNKFLHLINGLLGPRGELARKGSKDIALVENQVGMWRRKKETEARLEQAKLQKQADRQYQREIKKAEEKGIEPPPPPPVVSLEKTSTITKTDTGASAHTRKEWGFEVEDLKKLAKAALDGKVGIEVIQANEQVIRSLVRSGIRNIPGVKIFQTQKTITRSS